MVLSTELINHLNRDDSDEPLTKRLKLAENVLYSVDISIARKEDCIFGWLCNELSDENDSTIWKTIYRCLLVDPMNFSRLSIEFKNLLIEKLIQTVNGFPVRQVSEDTIKSCIYIFSIANSHSYSKKSKLIFLMKALILFTSKVLNVHKLDNCLQFEKSDLAIECVENIIVSIFQIYKQNFVDKTNFMISFIEEILFPISSLITIIKFKKISSKIIIESQKCIKKLILNNIKNTIQLLVEKSTITEEIEILFNTLKSKVIEAKFEDVKAVFSLLFQCTVYTFRQNITLVDLILRKLWKCIEKKNQSKQILATLLENSENISYNFDNEIEGVSLRTFLKTQIEEIISKKKDFKCSDYELLSAIAKLNPLIIEDFIQSLLQRILFEKKMSENEIIAYQNLITELWKSTVRLRRQHKFISKFLLAINIYKEKELDVEFKNKLELSKNFIVEFSKDLKSRTTTTQILAMFNTLIFHLKTDCVNKLKTSENITQVCLSIKIIANFLILFFEYSNFSDSSLTYDWQIKFYQTFTDLNNILTIFTENLCDSKIQHETIIFVAFSNIVKIWSEVYDLLRYYIPNIASNELNFPINEVQFKKFKQMVKKCKHQDCIESLDQLTLFKLVIYDRKNQQPLKEKIIIQLWSVITVNHFEIIESFNEVQILKLTSNLVKEATSTQDNLFKWIVVLKQNIFRITKIFVTATALQSISNIVNNIEFCSTKMIVENLDFEMVLKSMNDPKNCKKALKWATKEIAKQDFKPLKVINFDQIQRNLIFMSNLPLSFLNTPIRKFLFMILYIFDEETKNMTNFKEFITRLYLDLLSQNDIDILNSVSKSSILIDHFKNNKIILFKIFKLSLRNLSTLSFWEEFIIKEEYNRQICSILLICIESSKNKICLNNYKNALENLSLKLRNKIIKDLDININSLYEISGLRVVLKIALSEKQKLTRNLKSCIALTLQNIKKDMNKSCNNKLIHEILQLSLIVLNNRECFNITKDVVQNLCTVFINNPNEKIFFHFLEVLKDHEFQFFVNSVHNETKEGLINSNVQVLEKLTKIWESLSKAETKITRSKTVSLSVNNLFKELLTLEIKDFSSIFLLKICRTFVTSKRVIRLTHILVDSIFVTSIECLSNLNNETKLTASQEALGLCLDFMRSKVNFILDRLPVLTNLFRKIITIILQEARDTNFNNEQMFKILAVDIEKFFTFFSKLKKDIIRISPYLIADLIDMSHATVLPHFMKVSIDFSIYHLLNNCDHHAISFLFRTLPVSTQQVFKTTYCNYIKYNKFTGKI